VRVLAVAALLLVPAGAIASEPNDVGGKLAEERHRLADGDVRLALAFHLTGERVFV
jgi:hypothetical protein